MFRFPECGRHSLPRPKWHFRERMGGKNMANLKCPKGTSLLSVAVIVLSAMTAVAQSTSEPSSAQASPTGSVAADDRSIVFDTLRVTQGRWCSDRSSHECHRFKSSSWPFLPTEIIRSLKETI